MSFLKRLGYYLGGISVGLFFLFFFFNGKRTQCNYAPSARVKNDIQQKNWVFEDNFHSIADTVQWFKKADIRFNESIIGVDSCNVYVMEVEDTTFSIENCSDTAYFKR
jgi:hypothetical protein